MMTAASAYEINNRTYWARFARLNRLATEARAGAISGDMNAIARFVILSDQAFEAQRAIYGFRGVVDVRTDNSTT